MADYYTLLTNAGIAYETACKAAGVPIRLSQISVGDGGGTVYNPAATATALKREVWRGPLNALFQDEKNPSWLLAEVTIPSEVGGWYVREAGLWTDTGILYAIVKYPESFKPILATSGSGKEFYIRSIFETSNASLVTLLIDDTVVKATRAWVADFVAAELGKLDAKQSVRVATTANIALTGAQMIDGVAVVAGDRVLVKSQTLAKDNGIWVAAVAGWTRAKDADSSADVTSGLTVSVEQGNTLSDTIWQLVTDGVIVLGTTALTFQDVTQGFAPINSPALVSPTANTPAQFDNSQLLINSAYLRRRGVEFGEYTNYSASTVMTLADVGKIASFAVTGAAIVTLPVGGGLIPRGAVVYLVCGQGTLTVTSGPGEVIDAVNYLGNISLGPGDTAEFVRIGNLWRLIGGSAALKYAGIMSGPNWTTQSLFDDSKSIATTEFTRRSQGNYRGFTSLTAATTLTTAAVGTIVTVIGAFQVTLPAANALPAGGAINFRNIGSGVVTVVCAGADNINCGNGQIASIALQPGGELELVGNGAASWWASGSAQLQYSAVLANTPPRFDNTKKLVTTEWARTRGFELGGFYSFTNALTGIAAHLGGMVHAFGSGPASYSIPDSAANGVLPGCTIRLQNWSVANLTLVTQGTDKMQESLVVAASSASRSIPPDTYIDITCIGNGIWLLMGTGVAGKTAPFGALMGVNGYQKLPSGLIVQWMTAVFSSAALNTAFNLPIAFPSMNFGCTVSLTDSVIYSSGGSPFVSGMANGLGQVLLQSNYTASQSAVRVLAFGI
ncbi:phage tail protein [Pseudomonas sp. GW456-E7]|nr:phage tail protein [Pseudomonas sp. GW456-E7]